MEINHSACAVEHEHVALLKWVLMDIELACAHTYHDVFQLATTINPELPVVLASVKSDICYDSLISLPSCSSCRCHAVV